MGVLGGIYREISVERGGGGGGGGCTPCTTPLDPALDIEYLMHVILG